MAASPDADSPPPGRGPPCSRITRSLAFCFGSLASGGCATDSSVKQTYCQAGGIPTAGRVWRESDGAGWYLGGKHRVLSGSVRPAPVTCIAMPLACGSALFHNRKQVTRPLNPAPFPQIAELRVRVRIKPWLHGLRMSHNAKRAPSWSVKSRRLNRLRCSRWCCLTTTTLRWSLS
ncbi:hypothetical protein D3C81_1550080 [compost metagenome]